MQKLIYLLLFFLAGHLASAQVIKSTLNALNNQDFESLSSYLDLEVELCLYDNPKFVSKNTAIQKLKEFFAAEEITSANVQHSGSNALSNSGFKILSLNGKTNQYRMFIYAEKTSRGEKIQEIRLDKQ